MNSRLFFVLIFLSIIFSSLKANDPCSAIAVANNGVLFNTYNLSSQGGSGVEEPPCGTYNDPDIWFSFVAPAGGSVTIEVKGITATDPAMAIYSGACGAPVLAGCYDDQQCGNVLNPGVSLTDLVVGNTYYIRVWNEVPGGGTFKMRILNLNQSNFTNQFNAFNTDPNCVQLTSAQNTQRGCSWYNVPLDFEEPFELEFNLFFGDSDAGADGICLVFSTNQACGETGGGIGASGIPNSLIIEFDTWDNGMVGFDDIPADHTSIHVNGNFTSSVSGPVGLPNIEDGAFHPAHMLWDPITQTFTVQLDGANVLTLVGYDIVTNCFNGQTEILWGWTASTGGAFNQQSFCFESAEIINTSAINEVLDIELCDGEIYTTPNGNQYNTDGTYTEEFTASNGCNSLRTINLTVHPIQLKLIDKVICDGEIFSINGNNYSSPGSYTLSIPGIPCDTIAELSLNVVDFDVSISKLNDLDCINSIVLLQAQVADVSSFQFAGNLDYFWSTSTGHITSGQGTDQITVDEPGIYQLIINVLGQNISCSFTSDFIEVLDNTEPPTAIIAPQGQLDCENNQMVLDGSSSNPGPLIYTWSTTDGNIVGNNIGSTLLIDDDGKYQLIIENFLTGCKDTAEYTVIKASFTATAQLIKSGDINCSNTNVQLISIVNDGQGLNTVWTTTDGNIITDPVNDTIMADQPGDYIFTLSDDNGCNQSYTITIEENTAAPILNAGPDSLLTCLISSIELKGSVSNPVSNYIVNWSSPQNIINNSDSLLVTINGPGTYILTVEDTLNHCITSDTLIINVSKNNPDIDLPLIDKITCDNLNVKLIPDVVNYDPDFVYNWIANSGSYTGSSTDTFVVANEAGDYTLTVSDPENGCETTLIFAVTGSTDQPVANAGPDLVLDCVSTSEFLTGNYLSNDQESDLNFNWITIGGEIVSDEHLLTVEVKGAGMYILEVTNSLNDCIDSDTLMIIQSTDKPIIDVSGIYSISCVDLTQNLIPTWTNAGNNPVITWSTLDGNIITVQSDSIALIDSPGTYEIEVMNPTTGCLATFDVTVSDNTVPPVGNILPPDQISCSLLKVDLEFLPQGNSYTYQWSTTNGTITTASNIQNIQVSESGDYEVIVTDPSNGCTQVFNTTVTAVDDYPVVDAGPSGLINCKNLDLVLTGTVTNNGSYSVLWQGINGGNIVSGVNTLQPTVNESGIYILTIISDLNNCTTSDTVSVVKNVTDPQFETPDLTDANCFGTGGSISFSSITNGQGPYTFILNGDNIENSNLTFNDLTPGDYLIEGTDANGCKFEFEGEIDAKDGISFILPDSVNVEYGQNYQIVPEFLFDTVDMTFKPWVGAEYLDCNPCLYPTIAPTHDATLTLFVTDASGCPAEESIEIRVFKKATNVFVPNVFTPGDHNGINDHVTVFANVESVKEISEFRIFDRWGSEVFSRTNFAPNDEKEGWDGYYRGKLVNPAVYVYYAKYKNIYGEDLLIKGSITLIQ